MLLLSSEIESQSMLHQGTFENVTTGNKTNGCFVVFFLLGIRIKMLRINLFTISHRKIPKVAISQMPN